MTKKQQQLRLVDCLNNSLGSLEVLSKAISGTKNDDGEMRFFMPNIEILPVVLLLLEARPVEYTLERRVDSTVVRWKKIEP